MSLKDLFNKKTNKVLASTSRKKITEFVESEKYLAAWEENKDRFRPHVDFSDPANFARFGSAENYYVDSIKRIYSEFPYDSSLYERLAFHNSSSVFDRYVFEELYPRTNGYVLFSRTGWGTQVTSSDNGYGQPTTLEYIQITGTMNVGPGGNRVGANVYHTGSNRTNNLKIDGSTGNTVEFWLKKGVPTSAASQKEVIFDLWNGKTVSHAVGSEYGRLTIYVTGSAAPNPVVGVTYVSGTVSACTDQLIGATDNTAGTSSLFNDTWQHYAVTFQNSGNDLLVSLHLNGALSKTTTVSNGAINEVTGALVANIGALRATSSAVGEHPTITTDGWGKLSGSLDEFRFWKVARTSADIGRNWFQQVGGGTNTDTANTNLGVYYKFNEGITTSSSIDRVVLDYSGRISNGTWVGYASGARNTGSAMVSASASRQEYKDPIIYSRHPDVVALLTSSQNKGIYHDVQNNASLYHSMPGWVIDEDTRKSNPGELKKLTQIIGSYFDDLYLKIDALSKLKHNVYPSSSFKPYPFSNKLLESRGFLAPEIFVDASIISQLFQADEKRSFNDKLYNIKNVIYQNIYNNLAYIYKTKGTEKSFRNLFRCFGVDDDLLKLNLYTSNETYTLENDFYSTAVKKKYADFNHPQRFDATVYQYTGSGNSNSVSYLSATLGQGLESANISNTIECEVYFPKKFSQRTSVYFDTNFKTASLFGVHGAQISDTDDTTWSTVDRANFQVFAVKDKPTSKDVYFKLTGTAGGVVPNLTSSIFRDVYDNQKWNFAVRFKSQAYPNGALVTGALDPYWVEFCGYNTILDEVQNSFSISSSVSYAYAQQFLTSSKRLFVGAHRTNFTGSVLQQTDAKISSTRYWYDYLSDEVIKAHARDPKNFGTEHPFRSAFLLQGITGSFIPSTETLVLNWDFDNVTGSNSSGQFVVEDVSSGSTALTGRYGWLEKLIERQHTGRGDFFQASSTDSVDIEYLYTARQKLPEAHDSGDMISILTRDDETFTRDHRPIRHFFAVEKSMYQNISYEMLNIFATIKDFNNLIGEPVNRYRISYKSLDKLRSLFFERMEKVNNVEVYVDFYKWIDSSLSKMIQQLIPLSANMSEDIRNVVESHILERSKYWSKFPMVEDKQPESIGGIEGINKHLYNWKFGHAPINQRENNNCLYWNTRAERDDITLSSSVASVNSSRNSILSASLAALTRRWTTPYHFAVDEPNQVYCGANFHRNKIANQSFVRNATRFNNISTNYLWATSSTAETTSGSLNGWGLLNWGVLVWGTPNTVGSTDDQDIVCRDENDLITKARVEFDVINNREDISIESYQKAKNDLFLPFSMYSSSVPSSGYLGNGNSTRFLTGSEITNVHHDFYGHQKETPMQGPFTEAFVGGLQYRHVDLNTGSTLDTVSTRPEGWRLFIKNHKLYIKGPEAKDVNDTDTSLPRAVYYRGEVAKRPVNVKNISTITVSGSRAIGNYKNTYDIIQTTSRVKNNTALKISGSVSKTQIPSTHVSGVIDFPKLRRGKHKHVFVERFSAPGGAETSGDSDGGLGLDVESAEYSAYNSLNFRNLLVRGHLNTLLSRSSGKYGTDDVDGNPNAINYESSASYHKTPANTLRVPVYNGTSSISFVTASKRDNWFVQRPLPRTDKGYSWITASIFSYPDTQIGYLTSSEQLVVNSGSQVGVENKQFGISADAATSSYIPSWGVGLNFLLNDPISSSANSLGYPNAINWSVLTNGAYNSGYINSLANSANGVYLNALLNKRNGFYGWSSWKQVRVGEHPVNRYFRNNSIVSVMEPPRDRLISSSHGVLSIKPKRNISHASYTETPLSAKAKPLLQEFVVEQSPASPIMIKSSYTNNLLGFGSADLTDRTGINLTKNKQAADRFVDLTSDEKNQNRPIKSVNKIIYSENIFPKDENIFLGKTRKRELFYNEFWRNNRINRRNTNLTNSQGFVLSAVGGASRWVLDSRENFSTAAAVTGGLGFDGELLNTYTTFFRTNHPTTWDSTLKIGALYTRPNIEFTGTGSTTIVGTGTSILTGAVIVAGGAKWTAPYENSSSFPAHETYDKYTADGLRIKSKEFSLVPEFRISEHMDYYVDTNGGNFLLERNDILSLTGSTLKDSAQANFYKIYSHSDFLKFFDVVQEKYKNHVEPSKIRLKCKALMKFLPYKGFYPADRTIQLAQIFSQSYGDYVKEAGYTHATLNTNKGKWRSFFTPLFAPGVLYNSIKSGIAVDYPIYAAGTIPDTREDWEAGIQGAPPRQNPAGGAYWRTVLYKNFNRRIPFSALVEPENYLAKAKIWDMEPDKSASLRTDLTLSQSNQASSWGGQGSPKYKLAMHNFLAEVPNFFLKEGNLTTLNSDPIPKEGITITPDQANKFYGMDVVINNSQCRNLSDWYIRSHLPKFSGTFDDTYAVSASRIDDILGMHTRMYSKDSAFGPPWVYNHERWTGRDKRSDISASHHSYEPYTPAYFNGFGLVRLLFYPFKGSGKYTLDEIQGNLTASYIRVPGFRTGSNGINIMTEMLDWQTLNAMDKNIINPKFSSSSFSASYVKTPYYFAAAQQSASANWQQISSSIDFLGKTKHKKITYKQVSDKEYVPESFEDTEEDIKSVWVIQPKWETPIFNFISTTASLPAASAGTASVAQGMWHQYGKFCTGSEGIWIGINDVPDVQLSSSQAYASGGLDYNDGRRYFKDRSENILSLEKESAYLKLYIRDPRIVFDGDASSYVKLHSNDTNRAFASVGAASSFPNIYYEIAASAGGYNVVRESSYETCAAIAANVNSLFSSLIGGQKGYWGTITASAKQIDPADSPWGTVFTGSIKSAATGSGVGVIKFTHVNSTWYDVVNRKWKIKYPNFVSDSATGSTTPGGAGSLQNRVAATIGGTFPYEDTETYFARVTDAMILEGADPVSGEKTFGDVVNWVGGVTRDYKVNSLADLVGFKKVQKRLGETANKKIISEAVVAVPFIEQNGEKRFFNVSRKDVDSAVVGKEDGIKKSVIDMVKKMKKYVFPPKMDFITFKELSPFAMYIFEFEHELTRQDLANIWQNMPPVSISNRFEEKESVVEHDLFNGELMSKISKKLRWMLFKVKKKADWNYFEKTIDTKDDSRFKFKFSIGNEKEPEYNYNWPYDFFSLVELVKLDAEVEMTKKEDK